MITGAVRLYQTLFTSLNFLSNVVSIGKCDEDPATPEPRCAHVRKIDGKRTIQISENPVMSSLSLRQLRYVGGPSQLDLSPIKIKDNIGLCLIDTIDWRELSPEPFPVGQYNRTENDICFGSAALLPGPICQLGFTLEYINHERAKLMIEGQRPTMHAGFNHPKLQWGGGEEGGTEGLLASPRGGHHCSI